MRFYAKNHDILDSISNSFKKKKCKWEIRKIVKYVMTFSLNHNYCEKPLKYPQGNMKSLTFDRFINLNEQILLPHPIIITQTYMSFTQNVYFYEFVVMQLQAQH